MPRINSNEQHRKSGVHVFFRRTDGAAATWVDLGVLNAPPTQQNTSNRVQSFDERAGAAVLDESEVTQFAEALSLQLRNQQPETVALYLAASAPGTFTQNNTAVVAQAYTSKKGEWIALKAPSGHPSAGQRMYNVSAVAVKGSGGTPTYVANTDYIVDAVKGMIFIPTNSGIPDGAITVDYTPATMTARAQVAPQTKVQGVPGEMEMWEVSGNGARQFVRSYPSVRVTSGGNRQMGTQQDNFIELQVEVLADPLAAQPAGVFRDVFPAA